MCGCAVTQFLAYLPGFLEVLPGASSINLNIDVVERETAGVDSGERFWVLLLYLQLQRAHQLRLVDFDWENIVIVGDKAEQCVWHSWA